MPPIVARILGYWAAALAHGNDSVARPRSGNVPIHARLTAADLETIKSEQRRTGAPTLSAVMERLIVELLDGSGNGHGGMTIIPRGREINSRNYMISPSVKERMRRLTQQVGFNDQQIIRAAIAKAAKN